MWRNLTFGMCVMWKMWNVCCFCFYCNLRTFVQNLFCRNLRTFVWRKINQKLSPWRKNDKYQVCMICGQPLTITKSHFSYKTSGCEIGQKTGNQFCCSCRPVWSCPILSNPVCKGSGWYPLHLDRTRNRVKARPFLKGLTTYSSLWQTLKVLVIRNFY